MHISKPFFVSDSEVPCSTAIRSAQGVVKDFGAELVRERSNGLLELARSSAANGERDAHRVMDEYGLTLPIPLCSLPVECEGNELPVLRLRDWMSFMLSRNSLHSLCGLKRPDKEREEGILKTFWKRFRDEHPNHPIYELACAGKILLHRCVPVVAHGDEGRGRRHSPYLVLNWHSLIGRGCDSCPVPCREYNKLLLNFKGHSLTTRMLAGALPKAWYVDEHDDVFQSMLQFMASEAAFMASSGVQDSAGETTWAMMLGMTGDWPWLVKSGGLNRSFSRVQKHLNLKNPPAGICHLCRAGQTGIPFEDINTRRPTWLATMNTMSPFETPSPFLAVPHEENRFPEFFCFDVFHTVHLGVAKHLLGSLLALLSEQQEAANIDDRFSLLTDRYLAWCRLNKRSAYVRKLTKDCIGWPKTSVFPIGAWHKGEFSTNLLRFAEAEYGHESFNDEPLLKLALEATKSLNSSLRTMYASQLFLRPSQAMAVAGEGLRFLRRYAACAVQARQQGRALFAVMPKGHAFHHILLSLEQQAKVPSRRWILNPLAWSTQMCEDFVGRPSRLSRRVKPGSIQVRRVIQRHLKAAYHQWVAAGLIHRARS